MDEDELDISSGSKYLVVRFLCKALAPIALLSAAVGSGSVFLLFTSAKTAVQSKYMEEVLVPAAAEITQLVEQAKFAVRSADSASKKSETSYNLVLSTEAKYAKELRELESLRQQYDGLLAQLAPSEGGTETITLDALADAVVTRIVVDEDESGSRPAALGVLGWRPLEIVDGVLVPSLGRGGQISTGPDPEWELVASLPFHTERGRAMLVASAGVQLSLGSGEREIEVAIGQSDNGSFVPLESRRIAHGELSGKALDVFRSVSLHTVVEVQADSEFELRAKSRRGLSGVVNSARFSALLVRGD